MKKLKEGNLAIVACGPRSYGAGAICGLALVGTAIATATTGPAGIIAMGSVTGSACGFSIAFAWDD